ncbi:hypothetical protein [Ferruginibacter sp. SUN106]|uniref:hypothetical protein n=1 Tax=Ferruginibacter sp. SUN106 TaxID=2978348 RepID=UPI003D36D602
MSEEKSGVTKDIEELVNKTIEANRFFLSEGANIFKQFTSQSNNTKPAGFVQPEALTNAFNAYLKLNLQHAKNLIDLGVGIAKQSITKDTVPGEATEPDIATPAFILKAETIAGDKANLQFVLDNVKTDVVICQLVNTDYTFENDTTVQKKFTTIFNPQSFELKPGGVQTVKIEIATDKTAGPGTYISNVQVKGFEPAFFSIQLTLKENKPQQKGNGRKQTK